MHTTFIGVSTPETLGTDVAFKESETSPETWTEAVPAGCETGNCWNQSCVSSILGWKSFQERNVHSKYATVYSASDM